MNDHVDITIVTSDTWDRNLPDGCGEPWFVSTLLHAHARSLGWRPLLLYAKADDWEAWYPLLTRQLEPGPVMLARTPPFGGPYLRCAPDRADAAARAARVTFGSFLYDIGVASEFFSLSPFLPFLSSIITAWQARNMHPIVLAEVAMGEPRLRSTKLMAEVRRLKARTTVTWQSYSQSEQAEVFADHYQQTMHRVGAPPSALRSAHYFQALALTCGALLWEAQAVGTSGGATHIFARTATCAHYLYSARWGESAGCAGLALAIAQDELARTGRCMLNLGGGTTSDYRDSLLRFKARFADRCAWMSYGAIAYRSDQHAIAVARQAARPLPSKSSLWTRGSVPASQP
jgi:hypothetical protein